MCFKRASRRSLTKPNLRASSIRSWSCLSRSPGDETSDPFPEDEDDSEELSMGRFIAGEMYGTRGGRKGPSDAIRGRAGVWLMGWPRIWILSLEKENV